MPDYYTPKEVAEKLNVKLRTVQNMIHGGKLRAYRVGKLWRVSVEDFEAFKNSLPTNEPKEK